MPSSPVVIHKDALIEKLKSNVEEVRAHSGELHVVADAGTEMALAGRGRYVSWRRSVAKSDLGAELQPKRKAIRNQRSGYLEKVEKRILKTIA